MQKIRIALLTMIVVVTFSGWQQIAMAAPTSQPYRIYNGEAIPIPPFGKLVLRQGDALPTRVIASETGRVLSTFPPYFLSGKYAEYAFTSDGRLAVGTIDLSPQQTLVVDVETGKRVQTLSDPAGVTAHSISPDGHYVAATTDNNDTLQVWDVATGHLINKFSPGDGRDLWDATFSPDSQYVLAIDVPHDVCGCDNADRGIYIIVLEAKTGKLLRSLTPSDDSWPVMGYSISGDGQSIFYVKAGLYSAAIVQMDLQTGKTISTPIISTNPKEPLIGLWMSSFSTDRKYLLVGTTGVIFLVNRQSGFVQGKLLSLDERPFATISPDGKFIFDYDETATRVWKDDAPDLLTPSP